MTEQPTLDLEELAAFLDGRLSGERKERMEELLVRDERAYEIFAETVRFQQEERAVPAAVVSHPRSRRGWIAVPLAAAAVLAVAVGLSLGRGETLLDRSPAIVAEEGWDDPGWSVRRSGPVELAERYTEDEIAFQLGAHSVDLDVASAVDTDVQPHVRRLSALADAAGLLTVAVAYEALDERLTAGETADALARKLETAAGYLAMGFAEESTAAARFRLGRWAETGRLAALSQNADVLHRRRFVRFLRELRRAPPLLEIAGDLAAVEAVLQRDELTAGDFEELRATFRRILAAAAG